MTDQAIEEPRPFPRTRIIQGGNDCQYPLNCPLQ